MFLRCLALLVLCTLSSCDKSTEEKLAPAKKSILSWRSTIRLAANQWASGDVTDAYLRQTLEAAAEELSDDQEDLNQAPADHPLRKELERSSADLHSRIEHLKESLRTAEHEAARREVQSLPPTTQGDAS